MTWTRDGRLIAVVEIFPLHDYVESLAHELEHIIEQLDGVDLPGKAARRRAGVTAVSPDVFETTRATRVGQRVRSEVGS
jgi:hypothetical protein